MTALSWECLLQVGPPYGPVDYIFPVIKHVDHFSMFETIEYLQLHLYLSPLSTGISTQHFFLRILMHCMRGCAILFEVPTYLKPIHNRIFFIIASQSSSPFYPTYRSAPPTQKSCVRGALYLICLSRSWRCVRHLHFRSSRRLLRALYSILSNWLLKRA